jgi:hypothetical protein
VNTKKKQPPGLNSKGLPTKRWADEPSKTKRGKARAQNKKRHSHTFKQFSPIGTSYDANRTALETCYVCVACGFKTRRI